MSNHVKVGDNAILLARAGVDKKVDENAVVTRALVADNVKIGAGAVVGDAKSEHIELISKRVKGVE